MQVLCAAWTADGQHLALGMYNGHISICDKSGVEQVLKFSLLIPNYVKKKVDDIHTLILIVLLTILCYLRNVHNRSHQFVTG